MSISNKLLCFVNGVLERFGLLVIHRNPPIQAIRMMAANYHVETRDRSAFNKRWDPIITELMQKFNNDKKQISAELEVLGYYSDYLLHHDEMLGWRFCEAFIIGHWEHQHDRNIQSS